MTTEQIPTLTEFLLARIAEDEAVALAAISGQADPENGWGYGGFGSPTALTPHVGVIHEAVQAAHITRWHPARVLAECKAKRAIVEAHQPDRFTACAECKKQWRKTNRGGVGPWTGCPTIRVIASVYADHPDFDPAWA